jgi:hypothetical protein
MPKERLFLTLALVVLSVVVPSGVSQGQEKPMVGTVDGMVVEPTTPEVVPTRSENPITTATLDEWLLLDAAAAKRADLNPMQGVEFTEYAEGMAAQGVVRLRSGAVNMTGGTVQGGKFRIDDSAGHAVESLQRKGLYLFGFMGHLYAMFLTGCYAPIGDYDGDGITDLSVYRPGTTSTWLIQKSSGGTTTTAWGTVGDIPVPGDYDGDGKTDIAVLRCSTGEWWVKKSTGGSFVVTWGVCGDIPVPADYDNDGITDIAVFHCSTHQWVIRLSASLQTKIDYWGNCGDLPVEADYDGDGRADIAVFRCSTNQWFIKYSSTGKQVVDYWGTCGMEPVPFDYDGDCRADISVWDPTSTQWFLKLSSGVISGSGDVRIDTWGTSSEIPVAADFDGDYLADPAVWNPSNGAWSLKRSVVGPKTISWGQSGDIPVVSIFSVSSAMGWFGYY